MSTSVNYWLAAEYRRNESEIVGDASPAKSMSKKLMDVMATWRETFDKKAESIALWFVRRSNMYATTSVSNKLKAQGMTVNMRITPEVQNVLDSLYETQVSLIKSIPEQYLTQVSVLVQESVTRGRDVAYLKDELKHRYGITERRAKVIARDQNAKASNAIAVERSRQAGITHGIWVHRAGGSKSFRHSHVQMAGTEFDLSKGCWDDNEKKWVMPGELVNCLPSWAGVEFAEGCKRFWRRRYDGKLAEIVTDSGKIIHATPHHPILTEFGWVGAGDVNAGQHVFSISDDVIISIGNKPDHRKSSIEEVFSLLEPLGFNSSTDLRVFNFHGDAIDNQVDDIFIDRFLLKNISTETAKCFCEKFFSNANMVDAWCITPGDCPADKFVFGPFLSSYGIMSRLSLIKSLLFGHSGVLNERCLRAISNANACLRNVAIDNKSGETAQLGKLEDALAISIPINNLFYGQIVWLVIRGISAFGFEVSKQKCTTNGFSVNAEMLGDFINRHPGFGKLDRIVDKRLIDYSGHVYNLETENNWYTYDYTIIHNCRCEYRPVIKLPGD